QSITSYLVSLSSQTLSETESAKHTSLMDSVRDIERIGDHFENIIELVEYKISNKINVTDFALENLQEMFDLTILTVQQAVKALEEVDREEAMVVYKKKTRLIKWKEIFVKNTLFE